MKRFISLLLTLIVTLSLCACSNSETINNDDIHSNSLSQEEKKYVGTWATGNQDDPSTIQFMKNGKAIFYSSFDGSNADSIIGDCMSADWYLDNGRIILTYLENGDSHAYVFHIEGDTLIGIVNGLETFYKIN